MSGQRRPAHRHLDRTTHRSRPCGRAAAVPVLLLLAALSLAAGCRRFDLSAVLDGASGLPLSVSPSSTTVEATATVSFEAEGGIPPYTYRVVQGSGTIDATGLYTAPATTGSERVRVTDATGKNADAEVSVTALSVGLVISPSALSLTVNGDVTFAAIGGTPPYTFSITASGSGSPVVNATTGYYVAGASAGTDTVRVTDGAASTATATVTVTAVSTSVDYHVSSTTFAASGTAGTAIPGGQEFAIENIGTGAGSATINWKVYLSANTALDGGDIVVASGTAASLTGGASVPIPVTGTYPNVTGSCYLIAEVTAADDMSPGNNASVASPLTLNPKNIDYDLLSVVHLSGTTTGAALTGSFDYKNVGTYDGFYTVYFEVYASTDSTLDAGDTLLQAGSLSPLTAGAFASKPISAVWPTTAADYYLIVSLDALDDIGSGNDAQATASTVAVTGVTPPDVDYRVTVVSKTSPANTVGAPLSGTFTCSNIGGDGGAQPVYWNVYLSTDTVLNVGVDPMIDAGSEPALAPAGNFSPTFAGNLPGTPGTWYLIARVSASDDVNGGNNTLASSAISVTALNIDYRVTVVSSTGGTTAGQPLAGTFTVQNSGTDGGSSMVYWTAYVSTDATLNVGTDPVLDSGSTTALGAGATTNPTFGGSWPASAGSYYLIVHVSASDETNTANNDGASGAVFVSPRDVDYDPKSIANTGGKTTGYPLSGEFEYRNSGGDAGEQSVYWRVFTSTDDLLDVGDQIVDSGTLPPLGAGVSSALIPFAGTWPSVADTYYLIVELAATDDINNGNDTKATGALNVDPPDVDYRVTAVNNIGGTTAGSAINGQFTVQNQGSDNGGETVYWTAYVSSNNTLELGVDPVIDSGALAAPLTAGATTSPTFVGTWPGSVGTYYLIVRVTASDEMDSSDNTKESAGVAVTSPLVFPNYAVTTVTAASQGSPGAQFSAAGAHSFSIAETANHAGTQPIDWWVYISDDPVLDAGDAPAAASGSRPALGALGTATIPFDGTWPPVSGFYYLIVRISADDDAEPSDDSKAGTEIAIPILFTESEPNDDNTKPFAPANIDDVGTLSAYQLVAVSATMDTAGKYDTFKFVPAAGVTTVELRAVWNTGFDEIDLFFWNDAGDELYTQDTTVNAEPDNPPWTIINLTPGANYYVSAWFYLEADTSGSAGQPYTLYINTKP